MQMAPKMKFEFYHQNIQIKMNEVRLDMHKIGFVPASQIRRIVHILIR